MALSPQKLVKDKTAEDFKLADRLEIEIDERLKKSYSGQKKIAIPVNLYIPLTVEKRLRELYFKAGWRSLTVKQYIMHECPAYVVLET